MWETSDPELLLCLSAAQNHWIMRFHPWRPEFDKDTLAQGLLVSFSAAYTDSLVDFQNKILSAESRLDNESQQKKKGNSFKISAFKMYKTHTTSETREQFEDILLSCVLNIILNVSNNFQTERNP